MIRRLYDYVTSFSPLEIAIVALVNVTVLYVTAHVLAWVVR